MYPRILVMPGSDRGGSRNAVLAGLAALEIARRDADVTRISPVDYPLPLLDLERAATGDFPDNAERLSRLLAAHDGLFIATPEYNASLPPLVKNLVDWIGLKRCGPDTRDSAWRGKLVALACATDRESGGERVLSHMRDILSDLGASVLAETMIVRSAATAFDEFGRFNDAGDVDRLSALCAAFVDALAPKPVREIL